MREARLGIILLTTFFGACGGADDFEGSTDDSALIFEEEPQLGTATFRERTIHTDAIVTIVEGRHPLDVRVLGSRIYWLEHGLLDTGGHGVTSGAIKSATLDGTQVAVEAARIDRPGAFAVDKTGVYWTTEGAVWIDRPGRPLLAIDNPGLGRELASNDRSLFWLNGEAGKTLKTAKKVGGPAYVIPGGMVRRGLALYRGRPCSIIASTRRLECVELDGQIYKSFVLETASDVELQTNLVIDGDAAYWGVKVGGNELFVRAISMIDGAIATVVASTDPRDRELALGPITVDHSDMYWTSFRPNGAVALYASPKRGGPARLISRPGMRDLSVLAVGEDYVYAVDRGSVHSPNGALLRIRK